MIFSSTVFLVSFWTSLAVATEEKGLLQFQGPKEVTRLRQQKPAPGHPAFVKEDYAHLFTPDQADNLHRYSDTEDLRSTGQNNNRNLQSTQYDRACADPGVLYAGTGHSVTCGCDTSLETRDRVVCLVDDVACTNSGLCYQETDIWLFEKNTGELVARATCLFCSDTTDDCALFEDTCFYSQFNSQNDVASCALVKTETSDVCTTCQPCMENGLTGLDFNCYGGQWDSNGECITGNRLGYHPFAEEESMTSFSPTPTESPTPRPTPSPTPVPTDPPTESPTPEPTDEQMVGGQQMTLEPTSVPTLAPSVGTVTRTPEPTPEPTDGKTDNGDSNDCSDGTISVTIQTSNGPVVYCCASGQGDFESQSDSAFEFENCAEANVEENTIMREQSSVPVLLVLITDNYAEETSFTLTDRDSDQVLWDLPAEREFFEANTEYTFEIEVFPEGCYDFVIQDTYGDGLSGGGQGGYSLFYDGSEIASEVDFGRESLTSFGDGC